MFKMFVEIAILSEFLLEFVLECFQMFLLDIYLRYTRGFSTEPCPGVLTVVLPKCLLLSSFKWDFPGSFPGFEVSKSIFHYSYWYYQSREIQNRTSFQFSEFNHFQGLNVPSFFVTLVTLVT